MATVKNHLTLVMVSDSQNCQHILCLLFVSLIGWESDSAFVLPQERITFMIFLHPRRNQFGLDNNALFVHGNGGVHSVGGTSQEPERHNRSAMSLIFVLSKKLCLQLICWILQFPHF